MIKIPGVAVVVSALLLSTEGSYAKELTEDLEISGFARVVGGYLSHSSRSFDGYTNEVSLSEQSLFAVQPSYSFNDQLSISSQFVAHTSDDRDSGLEWAYLSYQPSSAWHLRAGKLRTPFFIYSDSYDVGYSYPWVTAPVQVYNNYLFANFNGASASYYYAGNSLALNLEAYYGYFKDDLFLAGSRVDAEAEVEDLTGIVATINRNNLSLRMSYHQAHNKTEIPNVSQLRSQLYALGYNDSARSLESTGNVYALQTSLSYDTLNSFYKAEWVNIVTGFEIAPEITGYYLMAGRVISDWTLHATYSRSEYSAVRMSNELPVPPTGSAQQDMLSSAYYQVFASSPNGTLESYTLGTRWDFRMNMALKAEATLLQESRDNSNVLMNLNSDSTENAYLYQVAWEWIF